MGKVETLASRLGKLAALDQLLERFISELSSIRKDIAKKEAWFKAELDRANQLETSDQIKRMDVIDREVTNALAEMIKKVRDCVKSLLNKPLFKT